MKAIIKSAIMRPIAQALTRMRALFSAPTVAAFVGVALLSWGCGQVYEPLRVIVPGVLLTVFGVLGALRATKAVT